MPKRNTAFPLRFALTLLFSTSTVVFAETSPTKLTEEKAIPGQNATAVDRKQEEPLVTWRDLSIAPLDLEAALQALRKGDQQNYLRDMRRITQMLENLLVQRTLAAEAAQAGLDKNPLFEAELRFARERILARMRMQAFEDGLQVPDLSAAAEEKYKLNPDTHHIKEAVWTAHVLVTTKNRSEAEALARAREVLARAKAGESFTLLVKEYSEDPSAMSNAGDTGFFERGKMVKPFEDAAFALEQTGDLSDVVRTEFGFHVIKLKGKRPARDVPFEELKPKLMDELSQKWIADQKAIFISNIKNDKTIKINEAAINALQVK